MKKFFFLACSALALTACSDVTDQVEAVSRTPISLDVYTQDQVRAYTATTETTLQSTGFSLRIYTDAGAAETIDETVNVTYNATKSAYEMDKVVYWPLDAAQKVNFVAYYGAEADGTSLTVDLTKDFVLAKPAAVSQSGSASGTVGLSFSHMLSDVTVKVQGDDADYGITLTNFSLSAPAALDTYDYAARAPWSASNIDIAAEPFKVTTNKALSGLTTLDSNVLVAPQTYTISATYNVTKEGNSKTLTNRGGTITFDAGKAYVVNITLPTELTPIQVDVVSVTGWGTPTTEDKTLVPVQ